MLHDWRSHICSSVCLYLWRPLISYTVTLINPEIDVTPFGANADAIRPTTAVRYRFGLSSLSLGDVHYILSDICILYW